MAMYLEEFQAYVRSAHDQSKHTCHWNVYEEITQRHKLADVPGPCDCPTHKGKSPCKHGCLDCASTDDVLSQPVNDKYKTQLEQLKEHMDALDLPISKGQEQIDSLTKTMSMSKALKEMHVLSSSGEYWGKTKQLRKDVMWILKECKLNIRPADTPLKPGCDCECFKNKVDRLEKEEKAIDELIAAAEKASSELEDLVDDLTASFKNTGLPVLKGAIKVVYGLASGEYGKAGEGASELLDYLAGTVSESGRVFALLKATQVVGYQKRVAMLGVIYHDQQLKARTCQPIEEPHSEEK